MPNRLSRPARPSRTAYFPLALAVLGAAACSSSASPDFNTAPGPSTTDGKNGIDGGAAAPDSQAATDASPGFVATVDADTPTTTCTHDPDCDDHEVCTVDTCVRSGAEISTSHCVHTPVAVGTPCDDGHACTSRDACTANGSCAGEPNASCQPPPPAPHEQCPAGCAQGTAAYPPPVPILPSALPASCSGGFELNNPPKEVFTIQSSSPNGAAEGTLDIEIATYKAPDHIVITGIDANDTPYTLVDTCGMQTADYADPTGGCARPPDDSIRQFTATLKAGTKSLSFDMTGGCTPTYLRVLGLCDFTVLPFVSDCHFRPVP